MPAPPKVASPAKKPEKPKDTGRFITATEGWRITLVAKDWKGTPYAPREIGGQIVAGSKKYEGGGAVKEKGADCSGSTWAIYKEAGFPYGPYAHTAIFVNKAGTDADFITTWFKDLVGIDPDFIKGKHFFKQVTMPQAGDIGWWKGHMAIYDNNAGKTEKGLAGHLWSATNRKDTVGFGPARADFFDSKNGADNVVWYRYWIAP